MRVLALLVLGTALLAAACGGGASPGTAPAPGATAATVAVSLVDNGIKLDVTSAKAGKITLSVKNAGSVVHSLVVIKTNLDETKMPASATDASKVDERGSVGATGQIAVGASKELTLDLAAGKYVLVCNEPAHYLVGMHAAFTVQ